MSNNNEQMHLPDQATVSASGYVPPRMQVPQKRAPLYDVTKAVRDFWPSQMRKIEHMSESEMRDHCKHMELPMARVKKVMRIDDDVRSQVIPSFLFVFVHPKSSTLEFNFSQMISSDAPLLLAAASEMFIQEITLRAWQLVEEGRRKTLQKSDIAAAASRFEHFDFLIDIVPREDSKKMHVSFCGVIFHLLFGHDFFSLFDELASTSLSVTSDGALGTPAQVQYVLAGDGTSGNDVYHLENGQVLHATPIGQPIPIGGPSAANIDISQLPPGMQILHIPTQ
ncbi:unnamed protein product [Nippostrongylus brasiliensis]|uniref:Nuclear transcription factor Y subunit gamma n=1 Tax=Nippostrongylus brasiliensis TaxID=27835 RepID=A0A0N4XXT0_NIPBR|nr:unnamed protein product [Nippostrongylus brasiliensis]